MINDLTEEEQRILSIIMSDNQEDSDLATIVAVKKMGKDRVIDLIREVVSGKIDELFKWYDTGKYEGMTETWELDEPVNVFFDKIVFIEAIRVHKELETKLRIQRFYLLNEKWVLEVFIDTCVLQGITDKVNKLVNGQE